MINKEKKRSTSIMKLMELATPGLALQSEGIVIKFCAFRQLHPLAQAT